MAELHKINVSLAEGQKRKIAKTYRAREEISIRLSHSALHGNDTLMVPMNTVKRLSKSKISRANIRKHTGKGILSSLLPVIRTAAPTIGKTLGLSALAGLASEGASQIVKKITGGHALGAERRAQVFRVPNENLFRLAMMSDLLTKGQIRDLARAHQGGADMLFRLTRGQVGNGIGSILASIAIPMVLDYFDI